MKLFTELNRDQRKGLSHLCFELAKAEFILMIVPTFDPDIKILVLIMRLIGALISGLAFTAIGVLLLRGKE